MKSALIIVGCLLTVFCLNQTVQASPLSCEQHLQPALKKLHTNEPIDLCQAIEGKTTLIINTASFCGYTGQFKALEALYQQYRDQGLVMIGFPSDSFSQEADNAAKTASVCYENYGVTFLMTESVRVKGPDAHPLFKYLADAGAPPRWNFYKYLFDANGNLVGNYASRVKPDSATLKDAIEAALSAQPSQSPTLVR